MRLGLIPARMSAGIVGQTVDLQSVRLFVIFKTMDTKIKFILIGSLSILGFYLFFEHKAHILGNSQYILFGIFILLHFFMHAGHGGHGEHKKGSHHE